MQQPTDLKVVDGGLSAESTPFFKRPSQRIGSFEVPYRYELWANGTYEVVEPPTEPEVASLAATPSSARRECLKLIAHEPLWIGRFGRALDNDEQLIELQFYDALTHETRTEWVSRLQLASKQKLVHLARIGVPVNDGNVGTLMSYLDAALHLNGDKLECVSVAARCGAYPIEVAALENDQTVVKPATGWLVGNHWVGPPNTLVAADGRRQNTITKGFLIRGSEDEWRKKWKEVTEQNTLARWLCYSIFGAPVLRFIEQRTFIIHQFGETGGGKSALMKFALAACGDPQLLMASFNRTEKSFTELFSYVDDLPVAFDELQSSTAKDHAQIIYALCMERGRARAMKDGGLQREIESWRTIVRMTGEEPIIGKGGMVDLGGQANRVVQIGTPVLTSEQAQSVHKWCEQRHYGHGLAIFLRHLEKIVNANDGRSVLRERNSRLKEAILPHLDGAHALGNHLSAVAVAQALALEALYGISSADADRMAIDDAIYVGKTIINDEIRESLTDQVLQLIQDHYVGQRGKWLSTYASDEDDITLSKGRQRYVLGIIAGPEVWLIQREINQLLIQSGLPPRRVWSDLKRQGLLITTANARNEYACVRSHGEFRSKVYVLNRAKTGPFLANDPLLEEKKDKT